MEKILHDWTPREIEALKRATAKLTKKKTAKNESRSGIKGVYYTAAKKSYMVHTFVDGVRIYAGMVPNLQVKRIERMKKEAEEKYRNNLRK
jgi:hypothetical protein